MHHYYYPGWVGVGVEIIRIKTVLSSAGLAYWPGTELGNFGSDKILGEKKFKSKKILIQKKWTPKPLHSAKSQ